jgi:2-polyprenyl-3-methyl-5-hydroxy-6-metoxy-1,4-benzoquinol methylase
LTGDAPVEHDDQHAVPRRNDHAGEIPEGDSMTSTMATTRREAFGSRMNDAVGGAFDVAAAYLGLQLGLYRSLAGGGPATAAELAHRTSTNERLIREWLEQQAATEILEASRDGDTWRFALPEDHAAVLLDPEALDGIGGLIQIQLACLALVPRLRESFRTGIGIPFADYGGDMIEGQASSTRPVFAAELGSWFAAVPDISARLESGTGQVLDVGCGLGWSSVLMARAFPTARIDGVDLDADSIASAREIATAEGVADRVRFDVRDASSLAGAGYDVATMFEMLHDLAHPVEVLRAAREALAPGGAVLVADELCADEFTGAAEEAEQRHYGWSILHCLPASMTEPDSVATGTVIRPATVRAYADQAGFSSVEILPVESVAFRLYLLRP